MTNSEVFLYLTTRGHRSGAEHEIEIWFAPLNEAYYIVSEKGEAAHWVRNLRAQPAVRFRLTGESDRPATARVVGEPDVIARVKAAMDAKYGWSNGLVVEVRED